MKLEAGVGRLEKFLKVIDAQEEEEEASGRGVLRGNSVSLMWFKNEPPAAVTSFTLIQTNRYES